MDDRARTDDTHDGPARTDGPTRTVRPLGVWAGLALGVAGAVTAGVGVAIASWVVSAIGVAVLVVGAVVGARSGGLYDVHGVSSLGAEVGDIVDNRTYEGVAPGDQVVHDDVRATSRAMDERREKIIEDRAATRRPPLAPIAGGVLLVVAIALLLAQGQVYPREPEAQVDAQRALGLAIVAAAAGLRYLVSPGRHVFFAAAALLAGVALVLSGLLVDHLTQGPVVLELVTGVVTILATATALASPRRPLAGGAAPARRGPRGQTR